MKSKNAMVTRSSMTTPVIIIPGVRNSIRPRPWLMPLKFLAMWVQSGLLPAYPLSSSGRRS